MEALKNLYDTTGPELKVYSEKVWKNCYPRACSYMNELNRMGIYEIRTEANAEEPAYKYYVFQ